MKRIPLLLSALLSITLVQANDKAAKPARSEVPASSDSATENAAASPSITPPTSKGSTNSFIDPDTRDLKPHDILRYIIDEDPQRAIEASLISITDVYDAHFPVSRGFDRVVTVNVRNKKLPDIRTELRSRLEEDYYTKATISLDLVTMNRGPDVTGNTPKAIFFGEMRGAVPLPEGEKRTVSEAVLLIGYNDFADLKHVKINRKDPATGKPSTIKVNVLEIIKENKIDKDVELLDGDRIEVPARKVIF